jgi:magnesium-transporting ATPase (P-type)
MATGDNILTAIAVAKECNIIDGETDKKDVYIGDIKRGRDGKDKITWIC